MERSNPLDNSPARFLPPGKGGANYLLIPAAERGAAEKRLEHIIRATPFSTAPPILIAVETLVEAWDRFQNPGDASANPDSAVNFESIANDHPVPSPRLLPLSPAIERIIASSVAGAHHILLLGPRGTGKTQALEWVTALQPPVSPQVFLEQTLLQELSAPHAEPGMMPVRRIGAQTRSASLLGHLGPNLLRPGEFSLAHGGVLLADELPEWSRDSREALREPLENGRVTLTRSRATLEFPARFTLAGTGNFCPCGGWPSEVPLPSLSADPRGDESGIPAPSPCTCPIRIKQTYLARLSGPILDRLDIVLKLPYLVPKSLPSHSISDRLINLRERVRRVRQRQCQRWGQPGGFFAARHLR